MILLEGICIDNDIWNPNWKDIKAEYKIDKRKNVFEQLQNFLSNDCMKIDKNKGFALSLQHIQICRICRASLSIYRKSAHQNHIYLII